MTVKDSDSPKSSRRWYQFSLRGLLLLALILGLGLSYIGRRLHKSRSHRAAVAQLAELGATIEFDDHGWATTVDFPNSDVPDPGTENNAPVRDSELACLKALPNLKQLDLRQVNITNAGLAHLSDLKSLRVLDLHAGFGGKVIFPDITDVGLEHLDMLTGLEELDLANLPITDAGLQNLRGLTNLRKLNITNQRCQSYNAIRVIQDGLLLLKPVADLPPDGSYQSGEITCLEQVTGAGLVHLSEMTKLEWLKLSGLQVHNAGLAHLKAVTELKVLDLDNTPVVDAGLVHLSGMTKLEELDLSNTQVTDSGLAHLKRLTNLRVLGLGGTEVTDEGVTDFQLALPDCKINR